MKKNYTLIPAFLGLFSASLVAQTYCTPAAMPYNQNMPGITLFSLNTINRSSSDLENYPNSSFVTTGLSTTLTKGQSYAVTIGYTLDASICPDMNLRVWIDFNQDGQLDDPGETVVSVNNVSSLTYNGNITIPTSANTGNTRLRVTAKMTSNGGHTLPTPCDVPADPIGYHGEFEDYTVNLITASGVNETGLLNNFHISPIPVQDQLHIEFTPGASGNVVVSVFDMTGKNAGDWNGNMNSPMDLDLKALAAGVYFIRVRSAEGLVTRKFIKC